MATNNKKALTVTIQRRDTDDSDTTRTPRTARFAEATSVYSPVDAPRSPFEYPTNHYKPQPQVSDVGLSYVTGVEMEETDRKYLPPPTPRTPGGALKSAMKSPGAPPRTPGMASIMSPTFREEEHLEKREESTEKEQAKDLVCSLRSLFNQSTVLTATRKSKYEYG
jgi:hypothetical protein